MNTTVQEIRLAASATADERMDFLTSMGYLHIFHQKSDHSIERSCLSVRRFVQLSEYFTVKTSQKNVMKVCAATSL
jgi:hypothetical protein